MHGDLHLGQTLRTAKGWKIVDFEGEPAKPLAVRLLPDSVWRDVAGMVRSFDYAPRVVAMTGAPSRRAEAEQRAYRAAEWAARNRAAFLEAYTDRARRRRRRPDNRPSADAYLADKIVYEAVYEAATVRAGSPSRSQPLRGRHDERTDHAHDASPRAREPTRPTEPRRPPEVPRPRRTPTLRTPASSTST